MSHYRSIESRNLRENSCSALLQAHKYTAYNAAKTVTDRIRLYNQYYHHTDSKTKDDLK